MNLNFALKSIEYELILFKEFLFPSAVLCIPSMSKQYQYEYDILLCWFH
jgi:hypothetical protein